MLKLIVLAYLLLKSSALYSSETEVIDLNPINFDDLVLNSDHIWVIEFYAPWCGHCQKFAPEYEKTARALKGIFKVGAVNADKHKELIDKYDVKGFPLIKIFGENKKKPEDYTGNRIAKDIAEKVTVVALQTIHARLGIKTTMPTIDVIELNDNNFDQLVMESEDIWLVEFYAPWCGHCKNLAPHWSKAALQLKGKVKLGAIDATVYLKKATEYGIKGYPTIKCFGAGKKDAKSAQTYSGEHTSSAIINYAMDKYLENIPSPDIIQLTSSDAFEKICAEKSLCVISILPSILDCQSKCRNDYLALLKGLGDKFKKNMWCWTWAEAGSQSALENALDMSGFGYPTLVVINLKKIMYSNFKGSFSNGGLNEFLRDLAYGRGSSFAVRDAKLPELVDISPWDGKDGELPQEEDADLSDVSLDEKVEL